MHASLLLVLDKLPESMTFKHTLPDKLDLKGGGHKSLPVTMCTIAKKKMNRCISSRASAEVTGW